MNASLPLLALAGAIREIALAAGAEIMEVYGSAFEVREKQDQSPVTLADERAESLIVNALGALDPSLPVIAEESVAAGKIPEIDPGEPFWLVDPLDGTKEFISRNGEFTVNIALVVGTRPVLGAVYAPVPGRLFTGCTDLDEMDRAFVEEQGAPPRAISAAAPDEAGLVVATSRSHANAETTAYLADLAVKRTIAAGSSLKFCLVAAGEADLYPRLGPTNEWDTAAGHAVLAAAGGSVETLDGDELLYRKPTYRNPHFVARGRAA